MGSVGKEENLEEVLAPPSEVYTVLTDINLAQMWGRTRSGSIIFPQENRMRLGQSVNVQPQGMKEPLGMKIKLMHYNEFMELEIVDGPMFGILKFSVENRPYGTLLNSSLDYRIESVGFNLKWKMSERKKYKAMINEVLVNIKNLSEQRVNQS